MVSLAQYRSILYPLNVTRLGRVPDPFTAVQKQKDIKYLEKTLIYDLQHASWHSSKARRDDDGNPTPRYGSSYQFSACGVVLYYVVNDLQGMWPAPLMIIG
jgi:hypothetical protein